MFTLTQSEALEMMMKPVRITGVVNELIALEQDNVISNTTVSAVVGLIFTEIRNSSNTLRTEWNNLILDIKAQSEYLYRTTDELNVMVGDNVIPTDDMYTYQIYVDRINDVYDKIKSGFNSATSMTLNMNQLNADFFSLTAAYKDHYANNYPSISYTANTMENIVDEMYTSESMRNAQLTMLNDLQTTYPQIAIESRTAKQATYLPNQMFIQLIEDDLFRIYDDANMRTSIGSIFEKHSLIAERDEDYSITVIPSQVPSQQGRRLMVLDHVDGVDPATVPVANTIFLDQLGAGNTNPLISGSKIRSIAFEGIMGNVGVPQFNTDYYSGKNSVIRYDE